MKTLNERIIRFQQLMLDKTSFTRKYYIEQMRDLIKQILEDVELSAVDELGFDFGFDYEIGYIQAVRDQQQKHKEILEN